ncbi:MAG: outer membrane beta-barrel protein [Rhodocyclaceae bacterium]|jgi:outer membrane protein|nr:outer membrane beta-barrel protein [Rhodocyclaceae bacterium]
MRNTLRLALLIGAAFGATAANAEQPEGNWMVRFRAVDLRPANESSGLGGNNAIHVEDKWIPEVDFSYFFTKNIAAELILTVPQQHDVKLNGTTIGSFKHLPPTLTLQYHFAPDATFRPYVGAGVNYTVISDDHLVGGAAKLDNDSWGGALQMGFDYKIGPNSYLNFDLKKVYIQSDVKVGGAKVAEVKVDPVLIGIGWGFKF